MFAFRFLFGCPVFSLLFAERDDDADPVRAAGRGGRLAARLAGLWGDSSGVVAWPGDGAEAEARDGRGARVWTELQGAEGLGLGGLVAETKDEDAGLDLFGREEREAAGLLAELDLRGGSGGERDGGKSAAERGVAPVVEGGEPAVEEAAGGGVGDEAGLLAEAGQVNDDEGVDVADVVAVAGGGGGVGGVAEDNGVDFVFVVFIVGGRGGGGSRGGAGSAGAGGAGVLPAVVTQGVDDGGEGEDGGHGGEQDGFGADGLGAGEIEAGSGGSGGAGWEGMLHR